MNDELEIKVWPPIFRAIGPGDDMVVSAEKLEAYISKHYIKKEDVLEAIGEIEKPDVQLGANAYTYSGACEARNKLKAEIKEKLNIGDK